jgi:anti-sigma factor RsiW
VTLRHDEVEELLGAYALDAVDPEEADAVEAHLADCPRCRAEVDAHREVAAYLARGGAPAPEQVWSRIAAAIDGDAPPPMRLVVEDDRKPRSRWIRWGGPALAAAAVLAIVAVGVSTLGGDDAEGGDLDAVALDAFESPDATTAELVDEDGAVVARAAVLPDGQGYLLAEPLPDLDEGTYQLWGSDDGTIVSLGVLGPAPETIAFPAGAAHDVLMISVEDAAVASPTRAPVAVGELA